jgi:pescadillo protein
MMSKKTKRLYDRMQHGIQKKKDEVDRLKSKRQEAEESKTSSTSSAAQTVSDASGKRKRAPAEPEPSTKRSAPKKQK